MSDPRKEMEEWLNGGTVTSKVPPKPRSPWKLFVDSIVKSGYNSPLGAGALYRADQINRGATPDQMNREERRRLEEFGRADEQDNEAFANVDTFSPANIGRRAVELLGGIIGGVDPTYVLSPGKTLVTRALSQGAINAGMDAASQGVQIKRGVRDHYDPTQTAIAGVGGTVLQGGIEGIGKVRAGHRIRAGAAHPHFNDLVDITLNLEGGGSYRNPKTSPVGAKGPMQVMDATARDPGYGIRPWNGKTEEDRARVGRQLLAIMMHRYDGDPAKAWAAYNWGAGRVDHAVKKFGADWLRHAPKETRKYVANGMRQLHGRTGGDPDARYTYNDIEEAPAPSALEVASHEIDQSQADLGDLSARMEQENAGDNAPLNFEGKIIGDLPTERLAPAFKHVDGRVYVGEENSSHIHLTDKYPGLEDYVDWENGGDGFATPDGQFLTREEAAKYVNSPHTNLESISYARGDHEPGANVPAASKRLIEPFKAAEPTAEIRDPIEYKPQGGVKNTLKSLLEDEQGSVPRGPTNAELIAQAKKLGIDTSNIKDLNELKKLIEFHKSLGDKISERVEQSKELVKKAKAEGKFKYEVGDRILTPHGDKRGEEPWRITGYYVDPKNPERYGYRVERGKKGKNEDDPESTYESSQLIIHDPKQDAKFKAMGHDFDRAADVAAWKKVADTSAEVKQFPKKDFTNHFEKALAHRKEALEHLDRGHKLNLTEKEYQAELLEIRNMINEANRTPDYKQYIPKLKEIHKAWEEVGDRSGFSKTIGESKKEVLTPAEKQEMDASATKPENKNNGADGVVSKIKQILKDILNDNEGTFRPFGRDGGPAGPDGEGPRNPYEGLTAKEKLLQAVRDARPASREQRDIIHRERGRQAAVLNEIQRQGGSYEEQLGAVRGPLRAADYESVRPHFTDEDIDELQQMINSSPRLRAFEKLSTATSLRKILSPEGVKVPTQLELKNLQDVFGSDLIETISRRYEMTNAELFGEVMSIPKSVMASGDISGTTRQGIWFVGRKHFWKSYPKAVKLLFDRYGSGLLTEGKAYEELMEGIRDMPFYKEMKEAGVRLGDKNLDREDFFSGSIAEHMPGNNFASKLWNQTIGRHVAASDEAFLGALASIRAGVFHDIYAAGLNAGRAWSHKDLRRLGDYVNTGSGRGGLGKAEQSATWLATYLWSPRLIASRVKLLNPIAYGKMLIEDPMLAKELVRDAVSYVTAMSTVLGMAALAGASVELDSRSTDFAKIKVGDTRVDISGGFQPFIRLVAQTLTQQKKNSKGEMEDLLDGGFGKDSLFNVWADFIKNKLAPVPAYAAGWADQSRGIPFDEKAEAAQLAFPLWMSQAYEDFQTQGNSAAWQIIPSIVGFGVQTYGTKKPNDKKADTDPKSEMDEWLNGGSKSEGAADPKTEMDDWLNGK